jgi:predicted transcriptional regulator of viral defense system
MNVTEYIKKLQSDEEYSFSTKELIDYSGKNELSVKRELSRLTKKKDIVNLRKGFYLIIPPRYSVSGKLPVQLYSNKLFNFLEREYYLGFYTAAKIHGASHQQVHRDYIMIETPKLIDIKKNVYDIRFLTTTNLINKNILIKYSDAGNYRVSSPALTIVDLIHYQTKLGGINRILAVVEELLEEIDESDIGNLLTWYPNISTLQRLGFIMDETGDQEGCAKQIFNHLKSNKYYPILLSPNTSRKPGAVNNKWKVDINLKLDSDL